MPFLLFSFDIQHPVAARDRQRHSRHALGRHLLGHKTVDRADVERWRRAECVRDQRAQQYSR